MSAESASPPPDVPAPARAPAKRTGRRRATLWLRRAVLGLGALGLAGLGALALRPQPVVVELAAVERSDLRVAIEELGTSRLRDRYLVSAPIGGSLLRIDLRPGDPIAAGAPIARILPLPTPLLDKQSKVSAEARAAAAAAAQRQAEATITQAELAARHAERDLERDKGLAGQGAIPTDALARAELEASLREESLRAARFAEQMAAHEADMARAALRRYAPDAGDEHFEVTSPIAGRVLRVVKESAGVVQPGTPLVEVGDPTALEVHVFVLTTDAVQLRPGASATLERWGGEPLAAHVRTIEPSAVTRLSALGVEEQRVAVVLDLDAPREQWAALGDGYRVEVRMIAAEHRDVLVAPLGATFRSAGGWATYVERGGAAVLVPVELGARSDDRVVVTSGLAAGDRVIVHPSEKVRAGVAVQPR